MPNSEEPEKDLIEEIEEVWDLLQRKLPPEERRTIDDEPCPAAGEQLRIFEQVHTITFGPEEVEALVDNARQSLQTRDAQPALEGWWVDRHSAVTLLKGFPTLHLADGYTLTTFRFEQGGNGHGETWAVPIAAVEDLCACPSDIPTDSPLGHRSPEGGPAPGFRMPRPTPNEGIRDFMTKVQGDDTPWSYVSASFFAREAEEIGAQWHGAGWSWHRLMGTDETVAIVQAVELSHGHAERSEQATAGPEQAWETLMDDPLPARYDIGVSFAGPHVEVCFYTYAALGQERIEYHRDRFIRGNYEFSTSTTTVALGPGFIVT